MSEQLTRPGHISSEPRESYRDLLIRAERYRTALARIARDGDEYSRAQADEALNGAGPAQ